MKNTKDKITLSRLALLLFIVGLLGPFLIGLIASADVAFAFGLTSEVLALVFALLSKQHLFSKIVIYGIAGLALLAGIN